MQDADVVVANGAAVLDEHRPGWAEEINLDTLRILSCTECVLGQVYGRYGVGLKELGITAGDKYGFAVSIHWTNMYPWFANKAPWEDLQKAWAVEIMARRSDDRVKARDREMATV